MRGGGGRGGVCDAAGTQKVDAWTRVNEGLHITGHIASHTLHLARNACLHRPLRQKEMEGNVGLR
jgi:hypothetical protein